MTKSRWGATALLAATFVLGALAGGAASMLADREFHGHRRFPFTPRSYAERLAAELRLTPVQTDSVAAVLEKHQPAMDSIWAQVRAQFDSEREAVHREISVLLTPEQQRAYTAYLARRDSLFRPHPQTHGKR